MMHNLRLIPDVYRLQQQFNVDTTSDVGIFVFKKKKSLANIISPLKRPVEGQIAYNEHITSIKTEKYINEINATLRLFTSCIALEK